MKKICIAGTIGSGKSVICRMLHVMGYEVYDCDSRAKEIIDNSRSLINAISSTFGNEVLNADHTINRKLLSSIVFNNPEQLTRLNQIVHSAVREDLSLWFSCCKGILVFVETAIPRTSGILSMTDDLWVVDAPYDIKRHLVEKNRGLSANDFDKRLNTQTDEIKWNYYSTIINDLRTPLLPQLDTLLDKAITECRS